MGVPASRRERIAVSQPPAPKGACPFAGDKITMSDTRHRFKPKKNIYLARAEIAEGVKQQKNLFNQLPGCLFMTSPPTIVPSAPATERHVCSRLQQERTTCITQQTFCWMRFPRPNVGRLRRTLTLLNSTSMKFCMISGRASPKFIFRARLRFRWLFPSPAASPWRRRWSAATG